jgi:hypothetical protein
MVDLLETWILLSLRQDEGTFVSNPAAKVTGFFFCPPLC